MVGGSRLQSLPGPFGRKPFGRKRVKLTGLVRTFAILESFMAAYAGLAFLSFLWGTSFLLTKIGSRAFDSFDFALARG